MIVPKMTSTRYDLLDTLRDGASWSTRDIAEDTGRSRSSIQSVTRTLDADGLLVWNRKRGQRVSDIRITEAGLRWLWCVEQRLPGQAVDLVALILVAVEGGPMLTSQMSEVSESSHRLREVVLHLRKVGAVEVEHRRQVNGGSAASRITITEHGLDLLRCMRGETCFETWMPTCCSRGSTP